MPSRAARSIYPVLIAAASLTAGCAATAADDPLGRPAGGAALYQKLRRASVEIVVDGHMAGSGCFVDAEGIVLTAAHVVKGKSAGIEIVSPVAGRMRAERVASDPGHDLALLRVRGGGGPYASLEVAEGTPAPTEEVLLFSSPLWRHGLVLKGSVARSKPSYCWQPALRCFVRCFYIAGASPVGSSGGTWVDERGRIVGVQQGYLNNKDKSPVGIAFAAPTDAIGRFLADRRSREAATLGGALEELWTQSPGFIRRLPKGTQGIVTPVVHKGGPLAKAGLTKETIITAAEGKRVAYLDDILAAVRARKPGEEITLTVIEPIGKPEREVTLRLGKVRK
ncbi:MAG: S1C family serine protease [Planctomycetota bacterium]